MALSKWPGVDRIRVLSRGADSPCGRGSWRRGRRRGGGRGRSGRRCAACPRRVSGRSRLLAQCGRQLDRQRLREARRTRSHDLGNARFAEPVPAAHVHICRSWRPGLSARAQSVAGAIIRTFRTVAWSAVVTFAAFLAALLLIAGCGGPHAGPPHQWSASTPPTVGAIDEAAVERIPVAATRWSVCGGGLQCASAEVPVDYAHPAGPRCVSPWPAAPPTTPPAGSGCSCSTRAVRRCRGSRLSGSPPTPSPPRSARGLTS